MLLKYEQEKEKKKEKKRQIIMRSLFLYLWTQTSCLYAFVFSLHQDDAVLFIYMFVYLLFQFFQYSLFSGLELLSLLEDKIASRASLT
jgi:hypothetical protein